MNEHYDRTLAEIDALYFVEPEIKDLYIEGPEDARLFEFFLQTNNINDVKVISIDNVNFAEIQVTDLKSNKDKVIYLANMLFQKRKSSLQNIVCIVDRDFDSVNNNFVINPYVFYTDFANLEMYLFNKKSIAKFLKIGLKNFPLSAEDVINILKGVLIDLFAIRYARSKIDKSYELLKYDKVLNYKSKAFNYNSRSLLKKFLSKNNALGKEAQFIVEIDLVKEKAIVEPRFFIHGKDFFRMFFLIIKKVKNPYGFNDKSFPRAFYSSIEVESLKQYTLFSDLIKKYT